MSSTQRPVRRRSARLGGEEEDARPAKRAKTDEKESGIGKHGTTRKATATGKKAKVAYDEDADGFQFSRTRSKKVMTTTKQKDPAPAGETIPAPPTGKRKRQPPPETLERAASPVGERRRSARLSGGTSQVESESAPVTSLKSTRKAPKASAKQTEAEPEKAKEKEDVPPKEAPRLQEMRKPTKIALPFADTPIITRNKEMRKNSGQGQGHRRSSTGLRGRRASSLIESGTSNALPHAEVDAVDFYKHISQDLPEPRRMRQLLTWCATRAMHPSGPADVEEAQDIRSARELQKGLLRDFSNKSEMSDWFSREDTQPPPLVKKPNPRNIQNAAKLLELEKQVQRLQGEKAAWDSVLSALSSSTDTSFDTPQSKNTDRTPIDETLLGDPEQQAILSNLQSHSDLTSTTQQRLQNALEGLEFKIDTFADGMHTIDIFQESLAELADKVLEEAAFALEKRDQEALERAGMQKVGIGDVLRSFGRAASASANANGNGS